MTLELVSTPPATALGRGASPTRREECGVLEDEYASDEQRRRALQIGPAYGLTAGCGGMSLSPASLLLAVPQGYAIVVVPWSRRHGARNAVRARC